MAGTSFEWKLDKHQSRAVESLENTVVAAGAGSGKTMVLARRYFRLISEGRAGVDEILTLTFTRKAAAEMHSRIHGLLLEHRDVEPVKKALLHFNEANISTLDSFCAQIAGNWMQHFGLAPGYGVDETEVASLAEEVALSFVLDHSEHPSMRELVLQNGFEAVWRDLFANLGESYLYLGDERDFFWMFEKQQAELRARARVEGARLSHILREIAGLKSFSKAVTKARDVAAGLPDIVELIESEQYKDLVDIFSKLKLNKPGRGSDPDFETLRNLLDEIRKIQPLFLQIVRSLDSEEMIRGVMGLCTEFQNQFLDLKRSSGIIHYHDLIRMALVTLRENLAVREYYKKKFRYIMIDEFQDNNLDQKNLLYLLAERRDLHLSEVPDAGQLEPGKLFFVGDEKQSIYRFRGADVKVFKALWEEFAQVDGAFVSLPINYRSEPGLIEFYNRVFDQIFSGASEHYEAEFSSLVNREARLSHAPLIRLLYKGYQEQRPPNLVNSDEAEAYCLARFIRETVDEGSLSVPNEERERPVRYEDFALLMRSTGNQIMYERLFRVFGIPYTVQSSRSLFLDAPLNDIYALLQLALFPHDRSAYAALLRSPLINLSDDISLRLLLTNHAPFDLADDVSFEGRESERAKLDRGREMFTFIRESIDRLPIREMIFHVWHRFGYRAMLLRNSENHPYLEHYDYIHELAQDADLRGKSLAEFLDFIRPNLGRFERLYDLEVLKEESPGVQIATIHGSKGLEFPIVILANSGNKGRVYDNPLPYYISDEYGFTVNLRNRRGTGKGVRSNYFYARSREENQHQETAETKRLLYVAMTRATSHLVISGCHNRNNRRSEDTHLNMLLKALGWIPDTEVAETQGIETYLREIPDIDESDLYRRREARRDREKQRAVEVYSAAKTRKVSPRRREWSATALNELARGLLPSADGSMQYLASIPSDEYLSSVELDAEFGTLCHYVVQNLLLGTYDRTRIPEQLNSPFTPKALSGLLSDAEKLARVFLQSDLGTAASGSKRIETELGFLYRFGDLPRELIISGQLDLLFETEAGLFIIDFKTDSEIRPGEYDCQLGIYREALIASETKPLKVFLFYLRGGLALELKDINLPDLFELAISSPASS